MELFLISGYAAVCIALFAIFRIPLNRWTVPTASIGGVVMIFVLVQLLNYYHPYSGMSRQYLTTAQVKPAVAERMTETPVAGEELSFVAWFQQKSLLRLHDGSAAEVTFESIPGRVFSGKVQRVLPTLDDDSALAQGDIFDPPVAAGQPRIPVLINITDPLYAKYEQQIPDGSRARTAIYGEQFHQLALVRKTLLRMSAWMNYLSVFS